MQRRHLGTAVVIASIGMIALAGFWLSRGETSSGDVAAVEAALRPEIPTPVELGPAPTTTLPPGSTDSPGNESATEPTPQPIAAAT